MKQYIQLALVFFLATALIFAVIENCWLTRETIKLRTRLDNTLAELEIYHIDDAEKRVHDMRTWQDTIENEVPDSFLKAIKIDGIWYKFVPNPEWKTEFTEDNAEGPD